MCEKIFSKIKKGTVLHIVHKNKEMKNNRKNISDDSDFLQVACLKLENKQTFKPHKHIECIRETNITQESWVVIKGSVKAILYDIDDNIIKEVILYPGDCSITFLGGHNYECLEDNTLVYEFKTGPYFGQKKDKVFIGEDND